MQAPIPRFCGKNIKGAQPAIKVETMYDFDNLLNFQLMPLPAVSLLCLYRCCVHVWLNVGLVTEKISLSESHSKYYKYPPGYCRYHDSQFCPLRKHLSHLFNFVESVDFGLIIWFNHNLPHCHYIYKELNALGALHRYSVYIKYHCSHTHDKLKGHKSVCFEQDILQQWRR